MWVLCLGQEGVWGHHGHCGEKPLLGGLRFPWEPPEKDLGPCGGRSPARRGVGATGPALRLLLSAQHLVSDRAGPTWGSLEDKTQAGAAFPNSAPAEGWRVL